MAETMMLSGWLLPLLATLAVTSQASPGPVRDLEFVRAGDAWVIAWRPPEGAAPDIEFEVEDRGSGPWRPVHRGPETRLRVFEPRAGACTVRVRAVSESREPGPWTEVDCRVDFDAPPPASGAGKCQPGPARACLFDGRFAVSVEARSAGETIDGRPLPATERGTPFAIHAETPAIVVQIIDNCAVNGYYGVRYRARTALPFVLRVTDKRVAETKTFAAPASPDRPPTVQYQEVFATCDR